jgi:hypothetical protein
MLVAQGSLGIGYRADIGGAVLDITIWELRWGAVVFLQ